MSGLSIPDWVIDGDEIWSRGRGDFLGNRRMLHPLLWEWLATVLPDDTTNATSHQRQARTTVSETTPTVGSLSTADIGSTMTALGLTLVIDEITHYRDEYDGELRVGITGRRGRFDDEQSFPADTPCQLSDPPREG